jgi:succinate dehydrogenase / fumarate reductase cytochrome b subunit
VRVALHEVCHDRFTWVSCVSWAYRGAVATVTTQQGTKRAPKTGKFSNSVAKKAVMAVSGLIMIAYLIAHMVGNLHAFQGAQEYNHYATWLRTFGEPAVPRRTILTIIEIVLVLSVVGHMWAAFSLWAQARRARPVAYVTKKRVQQSYASRTVRWGGVILLAFIIYHILDLTAGAINPIGGDTEPYARLIADFTNPWITIWYVIAMLLLGFHLRHGIWSATQTLGQTNKRRERAVNVLAIVVSTVLTAGFLLVPLSIAFGLID